MRRRHSLLRQSQAVSSAAAAAAAFKALPVPLQTDSHEEAVTHRLSEISDHFEKGCPAEFPIYHTLQSELRYVVALRIAVEHSSLVLPEIGWFPQTGQL